jgi:hypothetical protein
MKRGRPAETYLMWLCYELACEAHEDEEHLPQHKHIVGALGGYTQVGAWLHLSPDAVEYHVRKAQKRRNTEKGRQDCAAWKEQRERQWWFYLAVYVENRSINFPMYVAETRGETLVITYLTSEDADALVTKAQDRLIDARGERDYRAWLTCYERREPELRGRPLNYRIYPADHPESMVLTRKRAAAGLRTPRTKANK